MLFSLIGDTSLLIIHKTYASYKIYISYYSQICTYWHRNITTFLWLFHKMLCHWAKNVPQSIPDNYLLAKTFTVGAYHCCQSMCCPATIFRCVICVKVTSQCSDFFFLVKHLLVWLVYTSESCYYGFLFSPLFLCTHTSYCFFSNW